MASEGPNSPGTIVSDGSNGGTVAWSNPGNAASSDNITTSLIGDPGETSEYLLATNFGFNIPSGSTIDGVVVGIERQQGFGGEATKDAAVYLVKGGTVQESENKADTVSAWPADEAIATYGDSADLWSNTWADSDINNSGFGVALSISTDGFGILDHITITVHYTEGGGGGGSTVLHKRVGDGGLIGSIKGLVG